VKLLHGIQLMSASIPLSLPNIDSKDLESVSESLKSKSLSVGPLIAAFEEKIAEYLKVKEVIAVSSATTGIELALASMPNLKPDDEVLVPAYTFPACINSVLARGLKPRLVDIDPVSLNIDVEQLERRVTRKTKAIIPVDAFGTPCDIDEILSFCESRGIKIIRDAACALGAQSKEKKIGSDDYPTIFSFHQRKIITTGEGGCVTTNDSQLADRLRRLRSHGAVRGQFYASFEESGFNFRISEIQAALGISQMDKLLLNIEKHAMAAGKYRELLSTESNINLSSAQNFSGRVMQSFIVKLESLEVRNSLISYLRSVNVESTIGTYDLSAQPAYTKFVKRHTFPHARKAGETTLALPIFASITDDQIEFVCQSINKFFQKSI
jgi:perosamine synthetase